MMIVNLTRPMGQIEGLLPGGPICYIGRCDAVPLCRIFVGKHWRAYRFAFSVSLRLCHLLHCSYSGA